jgi:hypothetical protein
MGSPASSLRVGAIVRIVYGVLALFAPTRMFRAFGFGDPEPDPRYFNALFGGRDIVVGAWIMKAVDEGDLDTALAAHMGCEATDTIALAQEVRRRGGFDRATVGGLVFNLIGWASWIRVALTRD